MNYGRGDGLLATYCFGLICLILSGCSQRINNKHETGNVQVGQSQSAALDRIMQQEAMLVNVPLPLYDERILPALFNADFPTIIVLGYKSPLSIDQITTFFMNQMERYGWKHLVSFEGQELILQFENPDSYCTIVIKPVDARSSTIFIYVKNSHQENK